MILDQRVIHQTTDISEAVNNFRSGSYVFPYVAGQYLYVGSLLPFNNLFFEMAVVNNIATVPSIDIWWNTAWEPAVDINDQTTGLFSSGTITFSPELEKNWSFERRASDVTGLSSFQIYNMFWTRFSWSVTMNILTKINYIGQKFSDDSMLFSYYPDLANTELLTAFQVGKTTWTEQHYMATEKIIKDLIKRNIIKARMQVLDPYLFKDAACHAVAEIAYAGLGKPYFEQKAVAREAYKEEMNIKFYNIDQNADGRLEPIERIVQTGFLRR